jgi:hypothetical protein
MHVVYQHHPYRVKRIQQMGLINMLSYAPNDEFDDMEFSYFQYTDNIMGEEDTQTIKVVEG